MASYELLREIVRSGANLTLESSTSYDLLRELVGLAKQSGSQITIPINISHDLIRELLITAPKNITFVDTE